MLISARAWAAAGPSAGKTDMFFQELGIDGIVPSRPAKIASLLARTAELRQRQQNAQEQWEEALFHTHSFIESAERTRRDSAHAHWMDRWNYKSFARSYSVSPIKILPVSPSETLRQIGNPRFFVPPDFMPSIDRSPAMDMGDGVKVYWLRFSQDGENVYAKVLAPTDETPSTPSLIYAHGLCMETEMLNIPDTVYKDWARTGIRLILPDAPGHNRRVKHGLYGGESFMVSPPLSGLCHFAKAAREFAILTAWAHGEGRGKVALGGISLGALSAQVAAQASLSWPKEMRPDAIFLVTSTAAVSRLGMDSAIAKIALLDRAMQSWSEEELMKLASFIDADANPPLEPYQIVALFGRRDKVTPFLQGGEELIRKWQIPTNNLFVRDQGHFSAAFGFQANWMEPLGRLLEIIRL